MNPENVRTWNIPNCNIFEISEPVNYTFLVHLAMLHKICSQLNKTVF